MKAPQVITFKSVQVFHGRVINIEMTDEQFAELDKARSATTHDWKTFFEASVFRTVSEHHLALKEPMQFHD